MPSYSEVPTDIATPPPALSSTADDTDDLDRAVAASVDRLMPLTKSNGVLTRSIGILRSLRVRWWRDRVNRIWQGINGWRGYRQKWIM